MVEHLRWRTFRTSRTCCRISVVRKNKGVGFQMSGIGILYNKDQVSEPPTSWSVLWDEQSRGRVTMFDYDTRMMAIAARLNGGDEYDI